MWEWSLGTKERPIVRQLLEYHMEAQGGKVHAGNLYLKESPYHPERECSWWSVGTGLRTGWHGEWHRLVNGGIFAVFDCKGRENRKHAFMYPDGQGFDYAGRRIEMLRCRSWRFDRETAEYVTL